MTVIDVESLLQEISPDEPCGPDLEYDPLFQTMERASLGAPERVMGESTIDAEPPDWRELKSTAIEVLGKSKDLRASVYLARALINIAGYAGLADGLRLVRGIIEQYWEGVHPKLDPDDGNDPTFRVNTLESLADFDATLSALREAPLVEHRVLGRYGLREIEIAKGDIPLPSNWEGEAPNTAGIDAAFMDIELEALTGTADVVVDGLEQLAAIEAALNERMEITATPDLTAMRTMLLAAQKALADPLERRGVTTEDAEEGEEGETGGGARISGEIASREDVLRVLDKICDFYGRSEPSSPVPILLRRAKKLVTMGFLDAVKNLAPGGISELEVIRGPEDQD